MTDIDQALADLRANPRDFKAQAGFYDLFLNSLFFVPTIHEEVDIDGQGTKEKIEVPLIIEEEDTDYLVFFDNQQRLNDWAEKEVPCLQLPGHVLTEMTPEALHWAMNIGTEFNKQFHPEEIAWLKDVVAKCKAEDAGQAE